MSAAVPLRWPLPDGREATLRAISPDDFAMESAFLDGLSRASGYNRLMSARHPSPEEIRRWTSIDPAREAAFVITTPDIRGTETMLAVGRLVRDDEGPDAEFALLVGDDSQRLGLGRRLLAALVGAGRERGVRTLYGTTLSTNVGMLGLGRSMGFDSRREIGDSLVTRVSLRLA